MSSFFSVSLKGQCHEIFCLRFFSWITFTQAPDNNIRIISNFFENSLRYSQVKVHHRCQRHRRQILPPVPLVLLTPVENLPPVSTIPAASLPPVLLTPVANNWNNIRLQTPESDTGGKPWAANISANFQKNSKRSLWNTLGLGETDSWKEPEAKNLVTLSL